MTIPPFAYAVMWLGVILGITAAFVWLARRLRRGSSGDSRPSPSEMLARFREAHAGGDLSEEEFQKIRTRLAPAIRAEGAGAAGGATTMADAAAALRGLADVLPAGYGVETERSVGDNQPGQRNERGSAGTSGGAVCDAAPPGGGDSKGEVR